MVAQKDKAAVIKHINRFYDCYEIGMIEMGDSKVEMKIIIKQGKLK